VIAAWRAGVAAYLVEQFPDAEVLSGQPDKDGVSRDKDAIFVWWPGPWQVLQRDISLAGPTLSLRYYPARSKQPTPVVPPDPGALEAAADALVAVFDRSTQAADVFAENVACYLSQITPNYAPDLWRVEATLTAYTLGAAA
jgi:hypothetical protein